jgi:hypothetical protein
LSADVLSENNRETVFIGFPPVLTLKILPFLMAEILITTASAVVVNYAGEYK